MFGISKSRSPIFLKERPKVFAVNIDLCSGCQSCVMVCSLVKEGIFSPTKSRVQVHANESKCFSVPNMCDHCIDPPCIPACPVNAITRDDASGIVDIDEETCIGCEDCVEACPFDSIKMRDEKAIKCDLCGGDPECAKVCYPYAIQYIEKQPATLRNKERLAVRRKQAIAEVRKGDFPEP